MCSANFFSVYLQILHCCPIAVFENSMETSWLDMCKLVLHFCSVLAGPTMVKAIQPGVNFDLNELPFMTTKVTSLFGVEGVRISRCGYTGEDGVEVGLF